MHPVIQSLVLSQVDDRSWTIVTNLLIAAAGVILAWVPSFLIRRFIFHQEPVPQWAGVIIAAVTLFFGMGVGFILTNKPQPAIYATAAVLAYFTVTRRKGKEAKVNG